MLDCAFERLLHLHLAEGWPSGKRDSEAGVQNGKQLLLRGHFSFIAFAILEGDQAAASQGSASIDFGERSKITAGEA